MTKQLLIAIAAELKSSLELAKLATSGSTDRISAVEQTIKGLAVTFCQFNPRFDSARFLKACGV